MKRTFFLAAIALAAINACKPDPAKSVKIVNVAAAPTPPSAVLPPWKESNCNLPPQPKNGPSTFVAKGNCSFEHTAMAKCRPLIDDMYALFLRNASGGATIAAYINAESYTGPGDYKDAQMTLTYQDGTSFYHWSSDSVTMTVSPGERSLILPENTLIAEPPNTGSVVVSGKLACEKWTGPTITETPRQGVSQ